MARKSKRMALLSIKAELNRAKIAIENGEFVDPGRIQQIKKKLKTMGYDEHQVNATIKNKLLAEVMGGTKDEV